MLNLWHKFTDPHCPECQHEKDCKSCETLERLLDAANFEKKQLLNTILELTRPAAVTEELTRSEAPKAIQSRMIPWKAKQQMLEAEARQQARILADKNKEITAAAEEAAKTTEQLEKELGITGESNAG